MPDPSHRSWEQQLEEVKEYGRKHGFTVEIVAKEKAAPEELPEKEAARV